MENPSYQLRYFQWILEATLIPWAFRSQKGLLAHIEPSTLALVTF
jgi:hypothetical protein